MTGKFYGIGVGPGDPELITLKGARLIKEVDVICVPKAKTEKGSFALAIVEKLVPEGKQILEVVMPMTKDPVKLQEYWLEGAKEIFNLLQKGLDVAFLTLGDTMLYSTYSYLLKNLQKLDSELEIITVPGITSFAAAAARTNTPLAEGDEPLVILPVQEEGDNLKEILDSFPNAVLMKVAAKFPRIKKVLEETGRKDKAVYISRCGCPDELIETNLDNLTGEKLNYFSLILVKKEGN